MRIEIESDDDSGARFSQTYEGGEFDFEESELRLIEPVRVNGQVLRKQGEVELRGELQTKAATACSRCLKEVELPIAVNFSERFATAAAWQGEEQHELSEDDLDLGLADEAVELEDLVKEEILLALPAQVLCDENCKGICPNCGADRNVSECDCETRQVDARWEKLKDLRS